MKKVFVITAITAALLAGAGRVSAQRPVGDTIIGAEPTYMYGIYDWWRCANHDPEAPQWYTDTSDPLFNALYASALDTLMHYYSGPRGGYESPTFTTGSEPIALYPGNNIRGVQMVTDRPIKIVGIAACAYAQAPHDTALWLFHNELFPGYSNPTHLFPNTRDTTLAGRLTDSLMLYKPTTGEPSFLTGGPWRVEWPHRYLPLPTRRAYFYSLGYPRIHINFGGETVVDSAPIVPLYEVMFDKPQVVTDSFIVAGTSNNNDGSYGTQYQPGNDNLSEVMWLWDYMPTRYWTISYSSVFPWLPSYGEDLGITYEQNVLWYKYRGAQWKRFPQLRATSDNGYWIQVIQTHAIFPIIDPDFDSTLCDEVSDVRQAEATDTTLTLMWDGGNNVEWEVEYFEMNTPTVLRVTTTVPMVTLTGLRERTNYMARVRGRCEWDTEYGEWSGYVDLWTGVHHDDPVSTEGNLGRFTQMMPNPAREQVTVLSSYRLSRVVVYDLGGRAVLEQEDDGLATTLDVSGLAKGVYVVAIHTPAGIATKRLVVEN